MWTCSNAVAMSSGYSPHSPTGTGSFRAKRSFNSNPPRYSMTRKSEPWIFPCVHVSDHVLMDVNFRQNVAAPQEFPLGCEAEKRVSRKRRTATAHSVSSLAYQMSAIPPLIINSCR